MNDNPFNPVSDSLRRPRLMLSAGFGLLLVLPLLAQPARAQVIEVISFTNSAPITINSDYLAASPYPSTNLVTVNSTNLQKVTVSLFGLSDPSTGGAANSPGGLDILLAGPMNTNPAVNLMFNAGIYGQAISGVNLTVDDTATQLFSSSSAVTNGTYQPSGFDAGYNPPQTAGKLSSFIGTTLNGTWGLYIYYEDYFAAGSISGGWSLNFYFTVYLPSATTLAATQVGTTGATLNASVNPEGGATSVYFEWGPDTSYGNFTATNLISTSLNSNQNVALALTGLIPQTTNHFQAVAFNAAGTSFGGDLTVVTPKAPPVLNPVANQTATPGVMLLITNSATDANVPAPPLTYSLDASDPATAYITPNGLFEWTPACENGSTTNTITIWVSDNYTPAMSNSVSFTVTVGPCVQLGIGSSVAQIGTETCVPVYLYSTIPVSNLEFSLVVPSGRFTNWEASSSNAAIILAAVVSQQPQFLFAPKNAQILIGTNLVGEVCVDVLAAGPSAFAPLSFTNIEASISPASGVGANPIYGAFYGLPGRVVLIGSQPLLEATLNTNLNPLVTLYGNPGTNYTVQFATNLTAPIKWTTLTNLTMTNLVQFISPPATNHIEFFQAVEP